MNDVICYPLQDYLHALHLIGSQVAPHLAQVAPSLFEKHIFQIFTYSSWLDVDLSFYISTRIVLPISVFFRFSFSSFKE